MTKPLWLKNPVVRGVRSFGGPFCYLVGDPLEVPAMEGTESNGTANRELFHNTGFCQELTEFQWLMGDRLHRLTLERQRLG